LTDHTDKAHPKRPVADVIPFGIFDADAEAERWM
jgi:hypothetical protein